MHAKATLTFKLINPLPRDAMMSVLYVCLSVTSRYSITAIARLTIQSALDGSLRTRDKNLGENACGHPQPGAKCAYIGSLGTSSPHFKWHDDRFSHFCRARAA